jgi:hypothetical protein
MPCLLSDGRLFLHNNHPTAAEARLFHYISKLLSYYQDGEGAGLHFAAALAGGWRFELGAGEKELVRF